MQKPSGLTGVRDRTLVVLRPSNGQNKPLCQSGRRSSHVSVSSRPFHFSLSLSLSDYERVEVRKHV